MLLGSPPDMVHGGLLRGTDLSQLYIRGRRQKDESSETELTPAYSGFQVIRNR